MQPRIPLAFFAARARCWLVFNFVSLSASMAFSAKLLSDMATAWMYICMGLFSPADSTLHYLFHSLNLRFLSAQCKGLEYAIGSWPPTGFCVILTNLWALSASFLYISLSAHTAHTSAAYLCVLPASTRPVIILLEDYQVDQAELPLGQILLAIPDDFLVSTFKNCSTPITIKLSFNTESSAKIAEGCQITNLDPALLCERHSETACLCKCCSNWKIHWT